MQKHRSASAAAKRRTVKSVRVTSSKASARRKKIPGYKWLRRITLRYRTPEVAEKEIEQWRTELDIIVLRLTVTKVIKVY